MTVANIHDLNLHDSDILEVVVAGDEVALVLNYIEDYESMRCSKRKLILHGCIEASMHINLAYASPNSILKGEESVSGRLRKVRIETNTTGSVIEVVAASVELE
jgi:hypothetical protein